MLLESGRGGLSCGVNLFKKLLPSFRGNLMKTIIQDEGGGEHINSSQNGIKVDLSKSRILCIGKGKMFVLDVSGSDNLPYLKDEIFTLIEQTFDTIGAGTGSDKKTDRYNDYFNQLVVAKLLENDEVKLLSGYRYLEWSEDMKFLDTPMSNMFDIEDDSMLLNDDLKVLELGTAWSRCSLDRTESLLSFSGTWNGLAELISNYKDDDMFIGKMTIPTNYNKNATIFALKYLEKAASKNSCGVSPNVSFDENSFVSNNDLIAITEEIAELSGDYKVDRKKIEEILKQDKYGNTQGLPAMFPLYLSRFKKGEWYYVGTVQNGGILESGIVVPMKALEDGIREQYLSSSSPDIKGKTLGEYVGGLNK